MRTTKPMAGEATKRPWGYEYSPANNAFEIAPIGANGELDWDQEVAITADSSEANAALIVRAVNGYDAAVAALEAAQEQLNACRLGYVESPKVNAVHQTVKAALAALRGEA